MFVFRMQKYTFCFSKIIREKNESQKTTIESTEETLLSFILLIKLNINYILQTD